MFTRSSKDTKDIFLKKYVISLYDIHNSFLAYGQSAIIENINIKNIKIMLLNILLSRNRLGFVRNRIKCDDVLQGSRISTFDYSYFTSTAIRELVLNS